MNQALRHNAAFATVGPPASKRNQPSKHPRQGQGSLEALGARGKTEDGRPSPGATGPPPPWFRSVLLPRSRCSCNSFALHLRRCRRGGGGLPDTEVTPQHETQLLFLRL